MKRNCDFGHSHWKPRVRAPVALKTLQTPNSSFWDPSIFHTYQYQWYHIQYQPPFHPYYCTTHSSHFFLPQPHLLTSLIDRYFLFFFFIRLMDSPNVYLSGLKTFVTLILIISLTLFPSNSGKTYTPSWVSKYCCVNMMEWITCVCHFITRYD